MHTLGRLGNNRTKESIGTTQSIFSSIRVQFQRCSVSTVLRVRPSRIATVRALSDRKRIDPPVLLDHHNHVAVIPVDRFANELGRTRPRMTRSTRDRLWKLLGRRLGSHKRMMARIEMHRRKLQLVDPLLKGLIQTPGGNRRDGGSSCNIPCNIPRDVPRDAS